MKRPTKQQIEAASEAIRFLVPLCGSGVEMHGRALAQWTDKGLAEVKWPKDFGADERRLIRLIARTVLATR